MEEEKYVVKDINYLSGLGESLKDTKEKASSILDDYRRQGYVVTPVDSEPGEFSRWTLNLNHKDVGSVTIVKYVEEEDDYVD